MQQQERAENQVGEKADALIQVTCVHPLWRLGMERVCWSRVPEALQGCREEPRWVQVCGSGGGVY